MFHRIFSVLTHRNHNATYDIPILVAGMAILIQRVLFPETQLLNELAWSFVIFSSMITIFNYFSLLLETGDTIKKNIIIWQSFAVGVLGFISSLMLWSTTYKTYIAQEAKANFGLLSVLMFICTAAVRIAHCYLGGKQIPLQCTVQIWFFPSLFLTVSFFALVAPISKLWASAHAATAKVQLSSMIYCKVFLYVHWMMITFTFGDLESYTAIALHAFSFVYRTAGLAWIILLYRHICISTQNDVQENTPTYTCTCISEKTGPCITKSALVVGVIIAGSLDTSELVLGNVQNAAVLLLAGVLATVAQARSEIVFPRWKRKFN